MPDLNLRVNSLSTMQPIKDSALRTYAGSQPQYFGELDQLDEVGEWAFFFKSGAGTYLVVRHSILAGNSTDFHMVELS